MELKYQCHACARVVFGLASIASLVEVLKFMFWTFSWWHCHTFRLKNETIFFQLLLETLGPRANITKNCQLRIELKHQCKNAPGWYLAWHLLPLLVEVLKFMFLTFSWWHCHTFCLKNESNFLPQSLLETLEPRANITKNCQLRIELKHQCHACARVVFALASNASFGRSS
jgi:hypothetical protein